MLTIHSPKFSASSKPDLLNSKLSPSFRNKRIPSAQDHYSYDSNNIKNSKTESPSKFSEEVLRRKSQFGENNPNMLNNNPPLKKSKQKETQNIIDSIHYLKEEYKNLKQAYKDLIQEKIKNTDEIKKMKSQNGRLKAESEKWQRQNEKLRVQIELSAQQNERTRREYGKLLEVEKFRTKKLEQSLSEKEHYINQTLLKIRTEGDQSDNFFKNTLVHQAYGENNKNQEESLTISQDKSVIPEKDRSQINQSQFLSFSLTSVLEESTYKEPTVKRGKQHVKILSELVNRVEDQVKIGQVKSTKNKETNYNFKKFRKQLVPKLELTSQIRESKQNLALNNLGNLLNVKTPLGMQKKGSKNKPIKSFRKKDEEKQVTNGDLKHAKKKSKKLINLSSNQ